MGLGSFEGCQSKKSWNQKILLAKIGADTAENERNFAEILLKTCNYPTGPLPIGLVHDEGSEPHVPPELLPGLGRRVRHAVEASGVFA